VGWAAGVERLAMSLRLTPSEEPIDVFVVCGEGVDRPRVLAQVAVLRRAGLRCDADYAGRSVKGQLTQAGRLGARSIVRVEGTTATVPDDGGERTVSVDEIAQAMLG
jgi:histidyl-tRNA synthetase